VKKKAVAKQGKQWIFPEISKNIFPGKPVVVKFQFHFSLSKLRKQLKT